MCFGYCITFNLKYPTMVVETVCVLIRALYTRLIVWHVCGLQTKSHQYFIVSHIITCSPLVPSSKKEPKCKISFHRLIKQIINTHLSRKPFFTVEYFKRTSWGFIIIFYCTKRIKRILLLQPLCSGCNTLLAPCIYTAYIYSNSNSTLLPPCEHPQYC